MTIILMMGCCATVYAFEGSHSIPQRSVPPDANRDIQNAEPGSYDGMEIPSASSAPPVDNKEAEPTKSQNVN